MSYTNVVLDDERGSEWEGDDGKKKTNDDFRELLMTSKKEKGNSHAGEGGRRKATRGKTRASEPSVYRDRAKERREGDGKESGGGDVEIDFTKSLSHVRGVFEERGEKTNDVEGDEAREFARRRAIEESKYLGGDVERTHLVKGLDFALLRKVQSELEDGEAMKRLEAERARIAERDDDEPKFSSSRARAVYEYVTKSANKGKMQAREFASGGVSYSFNLAASSRNDVPTTTRRATDDDGAAGIRALRAYVDPKHDASLLTRLGKLMHYLTLGSEKAIKKFRREERRAAQEAKDAERAAKEHIQAAPTAEASDEDIFADAGRDYEPAKSKAAVENANEKYKSYFGDDIAGGEASKAAPKAKTVAAEDYYEDAVVADDARANAFGISGDYEECYPGYDVDVDDVGGFDKRAALIDGEDDEARKKREHKDFARKKRAEGNEFSKIRSMMKEKFGDKDDGAFEDAKQSKPPPKRASEVQPSGKEDKSGRQKRLKL